MKRLLQNRYPQLSRRAQSGLGVIGYVLGISLIGAMGVAVALGLDTLRVRRASQQLRLMADTVCALVAENPIAQGPAMRRFESLVASYIADGYPQGATLTGAYLAIPLAPGSGAVSPIELQGCPPGVCRFFSTPGSAGAPRSPEFGPLPSSLYGDASDTGVGQRVTCELKASVVGLFGGFLRPTAGGSNQEIRARAVWRLRLRAPIIPEPTDLGVVFQEKLALVVAPQLETNVISSGAARAVDPRFALSLDSDQQQAIAERVSIGGNNLLVSYPLGMRVDRELGPAGGAYLSQVFRDVTGAAALVNQPSVVGPVSVGVGDQPPFELPVPGTVEQRKALFLALANPATLVRNKLVSAILEDLSRTSFDGVGRSEVYVVPSRIANTPVCLGGATAAKLTAVVGPNSILSSPTYDTPWNDVCAATTTVPRNISSYRFITSAQMRMGFPLYFVPPGAEFGITESNQAGAGIMRQLPSGFANSYGAENLDPPSLTSRSNALSSQPVTNRWDNDSAAPGALLGVSAALDAIGAVQRCPFTVADESDCTEAAPYVPAFETLANTFDPEGEDLYVRPSHIVLVTHDLPPTEPTARAAFVSALSGAGSVRRRGFTIVYLPTKTVAGSDGRERWSELIAGINQSASALGSNVSADSCGVLVVLSPLNSQYQGRFCRGAECGPTDSSGGQVAFQSYWYYLLSAGEPSSENSSESIETVAKSIVLNSIFRSELAL